MTITEKQHYFQREYNTLFRYVYRYLGLRIQHMPDKEDLACQIIIEAYEQLNSYKPNQSSLRQWVTGIMKHRLMDYWRKRKVMVDLTEAEHLVSRFSLEQLSTKLDEQMLVDKMLQQLPPTTRTLFYMHYVDDLTYDQIAELTDKTPAAIRKIFSRAQQLLKHHFINEV